MLLVLLCSCEVHDDRGPGVFVAEEVFLGLSSLFLAELTDPYSVCARPRSCYLSHLSGMTVCLLLCRSRMLLGFLFAMTLLLLVAGCVSPSTFRLIVAILIVVNMAWVADLAIFSVVAAWLMRSDSCSASSVNLHSLLEEDPTLSRIRITRRTSLRFGNPLKISAALLGRSLSAEKHLHMTLAMEDMTATYHLPGVAGGWQARSFTTPTGISTALE